MTVKNDRTAVLMTCHNRKSTTLECLNSLLRKQEWRPSILDVYLVDDGSSDATLECVSSEYPSVNIIVADGTAFWGGGMRLAWSTAAVKDYDFYIWLNDDTFLKPRGLQVAFETFLTCSTSERAPIIVAGSICSPLFETWTYGGITWDRSLWSVTSRSQVPDGTPKPCDTFNGNFVLVSRDAYLVSGSLSTRFTHAIGDFEYGLRAKAAGCKSYATGYYVGECSKERTEPSWFDPSLPLKSRFKKLHSPKGLPPSEYTPFLRENAATLWPIALVKIYTRLLFPRLWQNIQARRLQVTR